jgi:hypothetical protein
MHFVPVRASAAKLCTVYLYTRAYRGTRSGGGGGGVRRDAPKLKISRKKLQIFQKELQVFQKNMTGEREGVVSRKSPYPLQGWGISRFYKYFQVNFESRGRVGVMTHAPLVGTPLSLRSGEDQWVLFGPKFLLQGSIWYPHCWSITVSVLSKESVRMICFSIIRQRKEINTCGFRQSTQQILERESVVKSDGSISWPIEF